jgi:hypothetical protein
MSIEIEKGIPIPPGGGRRHTGLMASMKKMAIGDSFLYPAPRLSSITGTASSIRRMRPGFKVQTRKLTEENVRVWRTA